MTEIINELLRKTKAKGSKLVTLTVDSDMKLAVIQNCDGSQDVVEYLNGEWVA